MFSGHSRGQKQYKIERCSKSQAAPLRYTVVRTMQKSIGKWEIQPPVKS